MGLQRSAIGLTLGASLVLAGCGIVRPAPPAHPALAPPTDPDSGHAVWRSALSAKGARLVISLQHRRLWLLKGQDTLFSAPVAIGKGQVFRYGGKTYRFQTPRGRRRVLGKETDPVWVPPDWHYYEKAARRKLEPVIIQRGKRYVLSDSTVIELRGEQVGRINRYGNFWPFTPGTEIIFDGKIFVPPIGSAQRKVPDALGTHKLDLGDGYLIHGTHAYNRDSIGQAVSHGCIRMRNEDIARLYDMVSVGTPVYIY